MFVIPSVSSPPVTVAIFFVSMFPSITVLLVSVTAVAMLAVSFAITVVAIMVSVFTLTALLVAFPVSLLGSERLFEIIETVHLELQGCRGANNRGEALGTVDVARCR